MLETAGVGLIVTSTVKAIPGQEFAVGVTVYRITAAVTPVFVKV
jgi:hypothetical protein